VNEDQLKMKEKRENEKKEKIKILKRAFSSPPKRSKR